MKYSVWMTLLLTFCVTGFTGCGPAPEPGKPVTEEQKKKLEEEMRPKKPK